MFGMLIACGFTAYIIGSIGYIFNRSNIIANDIKLKSFHINQFLMARNIPNSFRVKIKSYLEDLVDYKKQYKLEENEVLAMLNDNLRKQVIAFLNGNMLTNCPVFTGFSDDFISEITFILTRKMFAMGDNIFYEKEYGDEMYFITKGSVVLWEHRTHTFIKELTEGYTFGERSFFIGNSNTYNPYRRTKNMHCPF
jgi:hypothetical protein